MAQRSDEGALGDEDDDVYEVFLDQLLRSAARQFIQSGELDPEGLSGEELRRATARKVLELNLAELQVIFDHRDTLLEQARTMVLAENYDIAIVLYATWIEHVLNRALIVSAGGHQLSEGEQREIVRHSLFAKTSVIWRLVVGQAFPEGLRTRVQKVADWRNSFVHYKWHDSIDINTDRADHVARHRDRVTHAEAVVTELAALVEEVESSGVLEVFRQWPSRPRRGRLDLV